MSEQIQYDPQVIQQNARRLYREAQFATLSMTLLGILIGTVVGIGVGQLVGGVIGLGLGLLVGYMVGRQRAFALELQAQLTLCQAHIAEQTETTSRRVYGLVDALTRPAR
jgi:hypothetical protein